MVLGVPPNPLELIVGAARKATTTKRSGALPSTLAALQGYQGYQGYWHGNKGYAGVALLLSQHKFAERPAFSHPELDHEARIVVAELPDWMVVSIYVPNGGKDFEAKLRFLDGLEHFVSAARARGRPLLLCGDLNIAREDREVHPSQRKPNQIGRTPEEQSQFARMLEAGSLADLSRKFAPDDDRLFSWWAPWRNLREKNVAWRIDYILTSEPHAAAALSCAVQRDFGKSDHGPLVAQFQLFGPTSQDDSITRTSLAVERATRAVP